MRAMKKSMKDRFEEKYMPEPMSGCWLWTAHCFKPTGYGSFRMSRDPKACCVSAHRASWFLHRGEIPDGLYVLHRCDNRLCVNPDHLFLGTHAENLADASQKGRLKWKKPRPNLRRGERHPQSKLTADDVIAIRLSPMNGAEAARHYSVSQNNVSCIRKGRIWKHVKEGLPCLSPS